MGRDQCCKQGDQSEDQSEDHFIIPFCCADIYVLGEKVLLCNNQMIINRSLTR